jgi:hypothetical protein
MTSTELLSRLRALVDESSAGMWTDAELYQFLDSGQNKVINILLQKERKNGQEYHPSLQPLVKTAQIGMTNTPTLSYSTITDLRHFLSAELYLSSSATAHPMTEIKSMKEMRDRQNNVYMLDQTFETTYYTGEYSYVRYGTTLFWGFTVNATFITKWDKVNVYYISSPTAMASGQNPILLTETHESILYFATALAQIKNNELDQAQLNEALANKLLAEL